MIENEKINYKLIDSLNYDLPLNGSLSNRNIYISYITLLADNHMEIIETNKILKDGSITNISNIEKDKIETYFSYIRRDMIAFSLKDVYNRNNDGQIIVKVSEPYKLKLIEQWNIMAIDISKKYKIISESFPLQCYRAIKDDFKLNDYNKLKVFESKNLKDKGFFSRFSTLRKGDKIEHPIPFSSTLRLMSAIEWLDVESSYSAIIKFNINPKNNIINLPNSTYCSILNRNINDESNKIFEIIIQSGYFIIKDIYKCNYYDDEGYIDLDINILECDFYPKTYDISIDNYLKI